MEHRLTKCSLVAMIPSRESHIQPYPSVALCRIFFPSKNTHVTHRVAHYKFRSPAPLLMVARVFLQHLWVSSPLQNLLPVLTSWSYRGVLGASGLTGLHVSGSPGISPRPQPEWPLLLLFFFFNIFIEV